MSDHEDSEYKRRQADFHGLLLEWKTAQDAKSPRGRLADAKAARILGVPQSNYTNWLNKEYIPSVANAIQLEKTIPGVCEVLGYPVPLTTTDIRLAYINRGWDYADDTAKEQIYNHIREFVENRKATSADAEKVAPRRGRPGKVAGADAQ